MTFRKLVLILALSGTAVYGQDPEAAPKQEVGLTLGGLLNVTHPGQPSKLELGSGTPLQANYGYRLVERANYALYGEVHFLANPQRKVRSQDHTLTRDVATIFFTRGGGVKLFPRKAVAPYFAVGAGYAAFQRSTTRLDGKPNAASRELTVACSAWASAIAKASPKATG